MDIALLFKPKTTDSDISLDGPKLKTDSDLATAVTISLFTNRRANNDDILDNPEDRQGWWGDTYSLAQDDRIGSRLWILSRSKKTSEVLNLAREYAQEALQWLINDRVAENVNVSTKSINQNVLAIKVDITRPEGREIFEYDYVWRQIESMEG
jgi:phage gp46-like protein